MKITFLDDDHVMRTARYLLCPPRAETREWLTRFFVPEPAELDQVLRLGAGIRSADGAEITLAAPGASSLPRDAEVIVFRRGSVPRTVLESAPGLRLIQRLGARPDGIDVAAAHERGIEVSCLPRRSLAYTAEHALLLMLALAKRLIPADRAVREGRVTTTVTGEAEGVAYNWTGMTGISGLDGRTLGIVGLGEVGTLVAARARAFGMRVLYTNRTRLSPEREAALHVRFRPLPDLLAEADIVTFHAPGAPENRHLVGEAELRSIRPGAFLINTSRGSLLDEDALYAALAAGRVAGAALDVHAWEPRPPEDRFCLLDNVILTPHIGGSRLGVLGEIKAMFDNIRSVLAGEPPRHGRLAPAGQIHIPRTGVPDDGVSRCRRPRPQADCPPG